MTNEEIKAGIQEGEWTLGKEFKDIEDYYDVHFNDDGEAVTDGIYGKANALLFVDAGNTVQECGMLPSELWEEVQRLRRSSTKRKRITVQIY